MQRIRLVLATALAGCLLGCGDREPPSTPAPTGGSGASPAAGYGFEKNLGADLDRRVGDAVAKGRAFLLAQRDAGAATWGAATKIPVSTTAFAVLGLLAATPPIAVGSDAAIDAGLTYVVGTQRPDGSFGTNPQFVNYETAACVSALSVSRLAKFRAARDRGREFLVKSQIAGDPASVDYGGFPYKSHSNPDSPTDLSNAQFAATAAHDAELPAGDETWKRLGVYLSKVQNRAETNTFVSKGKDGDEAFEIVSGNDGGAGYAPGISKAGLSKRDDGKREPRSYGSMTYALIKCLLFAGAKPSDPRVEAAIAWISRHFVLDRNPGFEEGKDPAKEGQQGYYYYLSTMARALAEHERATGKPLVVRDADGRTHDWRREVAERLASLQRSDGSWINPVDRWEEGTPTIVTSYALQALATCQGRLP